MRAPASIPNSPVSGSRETEAVKPAADEAFPEVYTERGRKLFTYLKDNTKSN